ncbi:MAG TPA: HEAT repeat domain-containing protein [Thermoanaerobaculia bacterium]|jgi:HEAT repeat protein|nr:HEAT repeat domain-containing protein [Thermoanaerobaculia bacterium]
MEPAVNPTPSWDECVELLDRLPSMPLDTRVEALERLVRNPSPGIREQALRLGAAVIPDARVTEYLRDPADAVLRSAGSEIFRLRGLRSLPVVVELLRDPDADVVLQAVLILDRLRDPRALEPLHAMLAHPNPNVRQEAILAIGRLGDGRSIPHLIPFLDADFWVQMAAVQALGDLRSPEAVPHLARFLTDPLVGSLAAEALARIGGEPAFRALAAHWPAGGVEIDDETLLGLLAHVLEGLPRPEERGELPGGFREALSARLHDRSAEVRVAAARCLLVLGPSPWDGAALRTLTDSRQRMPAGRPAALAHRRDLVATLLGTPGEPRAWGLQLTSRFPDEVPAAPFFTAVREAAGHQELLPPLLQALEKVRLPGLQEALLDLYLRLPAGGAREALIPIFQAHAEETRTAMAARLDLEPADRLVLSALLGLSVAETARAVLDLDPPLRPGVISRLMRLEGLARLLPWDEWLMEAPDLYAALAAEAAARCGLRELLPALRARLETAPSLALVRALGALEDREAVPALARCLEARGDLRAAVLESLGHIGGPEARAALHAAVRTWGVRPEEGRAAYKALAACAHGDDETTFRDAAAHADWQVRMIAVEVLARSGRPENNAALAQLAGDAVPAVAHRALAALAA